ncbi:MAG: glycosyltransferase family 2 protein [Acetivibrionales bacterium]|jgi:glycosyltransferase involved in cell wall biosynthesis
MVFLFTKAYNAEGTIRRAIDSILNQTYRDIVYYLCDNASNDKTFDVMNEYAFKDKRIQLLRNEYNTSLTGINGWSNVKLIESELLKYKGTHYYAILDADDEYAPDFLEKMISFMKKNDLEVATCGSEWLDGKTGKTIKQKVIDKTLLLEGSDFAGQFPYYRNFMVTIWGAVYSLELLRRCNFEWSKNAMNFSDTAFCMEAFHKANRAGVLAECLHKYYISPDTGSYRYNPDWFKACKYLHEISREYLLDYGELSKQNQDYLWVLFFILLKYIIPRIQQADADLYEKLKSLHDIFSDDMTQYVLKNWERVGIYSNKQNFLSEIQTWLFTQEGGEIYRQVVGDIIASLGA